MAQNFILSCCSTVDMPYEELEKRQISVLFYTYVIDGKEYEDNMGRDSKALPFFYECIAQGKLPSTSQINAARYTEYFEQLLQKGDVLHITFSSGLTSGINNAFLAAEDLREKYPERKLMVVDSLCASSGYGMLVDALADLRDGGADIEEAAQWAMDHRLGMHHHFFSADLRYYRRTGRLSGPTAAIGTVLNICPLMCMDNGGHLKAYDKIRGKKAAIKATVDEMEKHAQGGTDYDQRCYICHSQCPEDAQALLTVVEERFPKLKGKVRIFDIGAIIASHTGPGTTSLFFFGDDRAAME